MRLIPKSMKAAVEIRLIAIMRRTEAFVVQGNHAHAMRIFRAFRLDPYRDPKTRSTQGTAKSRP